MLYTFLSRDRGQMGRFTIQESENFLLGLSRKEVHGEIQHQYETDLHLDSQHYET